jgi:hypothetical protein
VESFILFSLGSILDFNTFLGKHRLLDFFSSVHLRLSIGTGKGFNNWLRNAGMKIGSYLFCYFGGLGICCKSIFLLDAGGALTYRATSFFLFHLSQRLSHDTHLPPIQPQAPMFSKPAP